MSWWVTANGKTMRHDTYAAALSDLLCCVSRLGISADRMALHDRDPAMHPEAPNLLPEKMAKHERRMQR